ncbi:MAG: anti-sigma factor [Verrucomicrobia bacterium]|nr:MAG: anti-sigma factor [Verrucomicrobiota bacterium]TAE89213.1 MAG: anti-sigma factor [Verrucomicrobiota bacterium]TAF27911.1 MAG: anti-sigma factor [Verrucomicrobiota bacterium]TAF42760.1 MAG: anti-sigma factor [Verrucomicrobiota bacterium]
MSSIDERMERFAELDAGRALGDLDASEAAEWKVLSEELGLTGDPSLDLLAAALEASCIKRTSPERLASQTTPFNPPEASRRPVSLLASPWLGWAAAACLLVLLVFQALVPDRNSAIPDRRQSLIASATDLTQLQFTPAGDAYRAVGGEVLWSGARQEGYMTLNQVPANDPSERQYQLWIVDPSRDEFPVDGGVFDIPSVPGPFVIPIRAKLAVTKPIAFVITLEQPGGVVRSKQQQVVAIAKL